MKTLKPILLALSLSTVSLSYAITTVESPKTKPQVAGYYQYQAGDVQITALLDGTNFMSPTVFKDIT
jgi:hypothetical protein